MSTAQIAGARFICTGGTSAELPDNPEIQDEPHYFKGGYCIGTLIRWGALIWLASLVR